MDTEAILNRFDALNIWKQGDQRAPHKPLLVLHALGRWQRGLAEVSFREAEPDLRGLLREFGPPRKSDHPEQPFWRLQNDGLWVVHAPPGLPLKTNDDIPRVVRPPLARGQGRILTRRSGGADRTARAGRRHRWPHPRPAFPRVAPPGHPGGGRAIEDAGRLAAAARSGVPAASVESPAGPIEGLARPERHGRPEPRSRYSNDQNLIP